MRSKKIYDIFLCYPELIRKLIVANLNGESLKESKLKKYKNQIKKIPIIIKCESCYCNFCGEYNEATKLKICCSCNKKLLQKKQIKYRIKIYSNLKETIKSFNKGKFTFYFEDCPISDIKIKKIDAGDSKLIIHISPYFTFKKEFIMYKLNLNHIFLNWNSVYKLFNSKELNCILNKISDFVYEEKNNTIFWKNLSFIDFQNLTVDLLKLDGFRDPFFENQDPRTPGGIGADLGQDIICKYKKYRFLVQCKRNTGKNSVKPKDLRPDSHCVFHNCNAYLLVTSTYPTGKLAKELNDYNISKKIIKKAGWWNYKILREKLVKNDDIRRKYFSKQ